MPSLFSVQPPAAFGALVEHSWSLLPDPSALPWSRHGEAGGSLTPTTQKKGKNPSALGAGAVRAAKNLSPRVSLLAKSSREASPKIPQEEAASLTTQGGFSLHLFPVSLHLFPGSFTSTFAGKSESLPSSKLRTKPASLLTYQLGNTERERKTCGAHTEEGLENAQVPFSKGGRLVDVPGSLNLGVNTFLWLGFFSLFLNFHTGVVTAPPH